MPVGYLSDPELARLNAWPDEIAAEDAVTYFTLSGDDLAWLTGFNRVENRLGVAVQLSTLPWLGWIPDDLAACPAAALERLATAHAIDSNTAVELLRAYGGWQGETRRKHRAQVLDRLGWRLCAAGERKLLDEFLLARALEHDAPGVLLQLACDRLRAERIVRPSVDSLTRRVVTARDAARAETYQRLAPLLQPPRPRQLDGMLDVDPDLGVTGLAWLRRGATAATPEVLKAELDKLTFLRATAPTRWTCLAYRPGGGGCSPRLAAAPATRRCSSPTSTGAIRCCSQRWPRPTSRCSTRSCSYSTKRLRARTHGPGTSCRNGWSTGPRPTRPGPGCPMRSSPCSLTRPCQTSSPDG